MADITKQRLLRLSIFHYKSEQKTEEEAHNYVAEMAAKAASIHAKHGMHSYIQFHSPSAFQEVIQNMNIQNKRGWTIDTHDFAVEFYFRTFEEVTKVTLDPDFQAMQLEEEPWVSKHHIVTSLGWVETFVQDGKVVNIQDGKSVFPDFAAMTDLSSLTGGGGAGGEQ